MSAGYVVDDLTGALVLLQRPARGLRSPPWVLCTDYSYPELEGKWSVNRASGRNKAESFAVAPAAGRAAAKHFARREDC